MDDALRALRDAVEARKQQDRSTADAELNVVQQYEEWLNEIAVPTFKVLKHQLEEAESGTEIEVELTEPFGNPPSTGIEVMKPACPKFVYRLYLHEKTGTERAFVMKRRTVKNYDWRRGDYSSEKTQIKNAVFFDEREDGRYNHAPEITSEDIIKDFQRDYLTHRDEWF